MTVFCQVNECNRIAQRNGLCWAHVRRRSRGSSLSAPIRRVTSPWSTVVDAAIDLADSDSQDDTNYRRRQWRLRKATLRYARSLGYQRKVAR